VVIAVGASALSSEDLQDGESFDALSVHNPCA
jgi:predicted nucleic acid-binding protein